jgi:site-specific DNA-methyltransferase (adenine-specific)
MGNFDITAPVTPAAKQWHGWGTALKPAHEPIVVARKPLDGTVAENVLTWGVGAMNIDGCRVGTIVETWPASRSYGKGSPVAMTNGEIKRAQATGKAPNGRWPANVVLSHTIFCEQISEGEIVVSRVESQMPDMRGNNFGRSEKTLIRETNQYQDKPAIWKCADGCPVAELDRQTGQNASRFFYVAKASKRERPKVDDVAHPTVKPLALMRWLVRLVTPVGATVLEPFAGSGTTVEAALLEGCNILALEKNAEYLPLIQERMQRVNT